MRFKKFKAVRQTVTAPQIKRARAQEARGSHHLPSFHLHPSLFLSNILSFPLDQDPRLRHLSVQYGTLANNCHGILNRTLLFYFPSPQILIKNKTNLSKKHQMFVDCCKVPRLGIDGHHSCHSDGMKLTFSGQWSMKQCTLVY